MLFAMRSTVHTIELDRTPVRERKRASILYRPFTRFSHVTFFCVGVYKCIVRIIIVLVDVVFDGTGHGGGDDDIVVSISSSTFISKQKQKSVFTAANEASQSVSQPNATHFIYFLLNFQS